MPDAIRRTHGEVVREFLVPLPDVVEVVFRELHHTSRPCDQIATLLGHPQSVLRHTADPVVTALK